MGTRRQLSRQPPGSCTPDQASSHGIHLPCMSLPTVTGSGIFLVPLPEASKSFFFPMALRRWWCEWRCGVGEGATRPVDF
jgi:hypothetical protein